MIPGSRATPYLLSLSRYPCRDMSVLFSYESKIPNDNTAAVNTVAVKQKETVTRSDLTTTTDNTRSKSTAKKFTGKHMKLSATVLKLKRGREGPSPQCLLARSSLRLLTSRSTSCARSRFSRASRGRRPCPGGPSPGGSAGQAPGEPRRCASAASASCSR